MARRRLRCRRSSPRLCICIVFVPMFFLDRRGPLPVRAAGGSRGVRDAGIVFPFADADPDAGHVHHARARASRRRAPRPSSGVISAGLSAASISFRAGYYQLLETTLEHGKVFAACFLAFCVLSLGLVFLPGRRLLPFGGRRPDAPARARARRPAGGRDGAAVRRGGSSICGSRSQKTSWSPSSTTSGCPTPGINLSYSNSGVIGTSDAEILVGLNAGASSPHCGIHSQTARRFAAALSRGGVLLPAGRHRDARS